MIGKRKSVNVINRTGTPLCCVGAIGRGDDLGLINKFPVTTRKLLIILICNNVDFDNHLFLKS